MELFQGPDMVEFTGFLNNKFRVKAVAGDNLVSVNILFESGQFLIFGLNLVLSKNNLIMTIRCQF